MKQTSKDYSTLIPLAAIGIIVILSIMVFSAYQKTLAMPATVILPGGVTYLGK